MPRKYWTLINKISHAVLVVVFLNMWFSFGPVRATFDDPLPGVSATVYDNYWYGGSPPLPDISGRPIAGELSFPWINHNFNASPVFGLYDDFIVKYEGFISSPVTAEISFLPAADDGTKLFIDDALIDNNWFDKGGGGNISSPVLFIANTPKQFVLWFYENGGGAHVNLLWNINGNFSTVPPEAFTRNNQTQYTTTTSTSTTTPETTIPQTTIPETTIPETTIPETTIPQTTIPETTIPETTIPQTTIPETTIPETTTTTIYVPPATTTTEQTTTTTSYVPVPETTLPVPKTTSTPESTLPTPSGIGTTQTTRPVSTVPQQTTPTLLPVQSTTPQTPTTIQEITDPEKPTKEETKPSTTTVPEIKEIIDQIPRETTALTTEDKEKIASAVSAIIQSGVSVEIAQQLASNPAVIQSVSTEQAQEIFQQIEPAQLDGQAAQEIVNAVQEAPAEIREVFEDAVDLFQGAFDSYKMLGQTIDVGQRRTVVAVNLVTTVSAAAAAMSVNSSSSGSPSSGSSSASAKSDVAARKEEEEEPAGEIAGDGLEWIKQLSIYKIVNGEKIMDWKAFFKKFSYGIMNLGWTLAGSLIVYLTLSGTLQMIAGIASVIALISAMYLHMKEPE